MEVLVPPWAPTHYAGKRIVSRWPYDMTGEMVVALGDTGVPFPDATFESNIDKPLEVWGVHVELYPLTNATPPVDVNPVLAQTFKAMLADLVKLSLTYVSLEQRISKAKERVSALVDKNTGVWVWAPSPNTIGRSQGYVVEVDIPTAAFATGAGPTPVASVTVGSLRVVVRFFGFLLVLEGPADQNLPRPTMPPTE